MLSGSRRGPYAYLRQALYEYQAENEFEISIVEGDVMIVDHMDEDGWYSGWNEKTGKFGRFPSNYTEKL